jgi:predicted amidohydrolase YtcJ
MPRRAPSLRPALVGLIGLFACRGAPSTIPPDLIVYGRVWTGDSAAPWAGAVAVAGDTVVAVGDSARLASMAGAGTRALSSGQGMVVPGFIDGHTHFMDGGLQLERIDLRDAASPAEFIARLKAYATSLRPGEWIRGGDWDHERWRGAPLPARSWIDSVTPNNPVFINRLDGHMSLANSAALKLAGVTQATGDVRGGAIVRGPGGEPTGIFKDNAQALVLRVVEDYSPEQDDSALARAMAWAAARGVTGVASLSNGRGARSVWVEYAALQRMRAAGKLTVRVALYPEIWAWRQVADSVRVHGRTDDWIAVNGVKGYVDGSLGSTTALFYQPYADAPTTGGLLVTPEDSLRAWIGAADSAGIQVAVHAIGERANGLLLSIYDSVARAHGSRDRRFRIEHAQHLRPQDVSRLAALGVIASMQPYHALDDGRWAEKRIGPRIKNMYVFRSLLNAGAHLAFGSDWTVAPIDPLLGIYAAVTRRTLDGKNPEGWIPEQKITVEEALRAYTSGNAYGVFAERTRGQLAPGYKADLVLLDRDLTRILPEAIEGVSVRATVVGGRVVYQAK